MKDKEYDFITVDRFELSHLLLNNRKYESIAEEVKYLLRHAILYRDSIGITDEYDLADFIEKHFTNLFDDKLSELKKNENNK